MSMMRPGKYTFLSIILASLALGPGAPTAPRSVSASVVSVSYFYDSLAPYGTWIDESSYGWCWVPADVSPGWRPYRDGYWTYGDFGWTWVSNEPWGWGPYHYGRWMVDPDYGWVWVPGTEWAPAWVAWRQSDDWVGWAPLPPGGFEVTTYSFDPVVQRIPADRWCFVPTRYVVERNVSRWITPVTRNVSLIDRTRNATRFSHQDGQLVNRGVDPAAFQRLTGRAVPRVHTVFASSALGGHAQRVDSNRIAFFRPAVRNTPGAAPRQDLRMGAAQQRQVRARLAQDPVMHLAQHVETGRGWHAAATERTQRAQNSDRPRSSGPSRVDQSRAPRGQSRQTVDRSSRVGPPSKHQQASGGDGSAKPEQKEHGKGPGRHDK